MFRLPPFPAYQALWPMGKSVCSSLSSRDLGFDPAQLALGFLSADDVLKYGRDEIREQR